MSEEFIKEVDEDLKEEKRIKLWKKYFLMFWDSLLELSY